MLLTNIPKKIFIEYINKLSVHNLYPIIQMVENFIEKITKRLIKKQWVECFQKYHNNKLHNHYMHNIDHLRHVINNSKHFQHYFDNVNI